MPSFSYFPRSPGLRVPFNSFDPYNIVINRAPTANDLAELSTLWVQPFDNNGNPVNAMWILTSIVAGQATWTAIEAGGAAGVFSSLTVTPGPTSLTGILTQTGTANINTTGAAATNIGTGTNTGTVTIGSANSTAIDIFGPTFINTAGAQGTAINTGPATGALIMGNATGNTTVQAGNFTVSAGAVSATNTGVNRAIVGDTSGGTGVTATLTSSGATVDALQLSGGGLKVAPATPAAGASPRVASARFGSVAFTDVINAAATGALAITNTMATAASIVIATVQCSTVGSALVIRDIDVSVAGTITLNVTNLGGTNTGANIVVNFWLLN